MKRKFRNVAIGFALFVLLVVLIKGVLFRWVVVYGSDGPRKVSVAASSDMKAWISAEADRDALDDEHGIVTEAQRLTAKRLQFTTGPCASDAATVFKERKANCIGYAALCAAISNTLFEMRGLNGQWKTHVETAHLRVFGVNVHAWLDSPFLQNHDLMTIEDRRGNVHFAVDPTVFEYFGITSVTWTIDGGED